MSLATETVWLQRPSGYRAPPPPHNLLIARRVVLSVYIYIYIYIYVCVERERERERDGDFKELKSLYRPFKKFKGSV